MLNAQSDNFEMGKPLAVVAIVLMLAVCGSITWSLSAKLDQTVLALILAFVLSQLALIAPRVAITMTFILLAILGDVRRLMLYYIGPVQYDVLLLVGPLIGALLMFTAVFQGKLATRTKLGWYITILMILMVLQIFNAQQGGLAVGLGGALFYIVPLIWFWVGQTFGTEEFLTFILYKVVVPLGVLAGLLGCYQTWIGFPDYQYEWIRSQSNIAVFVGGRARPFGFFVSPPEYAIYCAIGSVVLLSRLALKKFRPSMLFAPFLLLCCFLQGSRSHLLFNVAGLAGIWGLRARPGEKAIVWPRLIASTVIIFGLLAGAIFWLQDSQVSGDVNAMVSYQVQGLTNPLESSATGHGELFYTGILSSLVNPWGMGLGATTQAAGKLGGGAAGGTENDVSNMFVSLGPVGGILYVIVLFWMFRTTILYSRRSGSTIGLAMLGLQICIAGHWLNGGHYAVATLLWFSVGVVDRLNLDWERERLIA